MLIRNIFLTFMQVQIQIQSLIHTTFSCIAYLRDLLDESCFEDQRLGTSVIKKLVKTEESKEILELLQGMYEAVGQEYLASFEVALYLEKDRSSEIHESYTFEVNYGEEEEIKEKEEMVRKFCLCLQRLGPLPPEKYATIKLYYNERVPPTYNPTGFKDGTSHSFKYNKSKVKIESSMKSVVPKEMYLCEEKERGSTFVMTGDTNEDKNVDKHEDKDKFNLDTNEDKDRFNLDKDIPKVRCMCGHPSDTFDIIQCDSCKYWLHTVCCGFYSNSDKRIPRGEYICSICQGKGDRTLSLVRKTLSVVYNEGYRSRVWLCRRLGVSSKDFQEINLRIVEEGFMKEERVGKKYKVRVVKDDGIKRKIKEYFKSRRSSIPKKDVMMRR